MRISKKCVIPGLTITLLLGAASAAHAQADTSASATPEEGVVVTGSRIARRDYVAVSPITTVSQDAIAAAGSVTLENTMNQLPQLVTSAGASAAITPRGGQASINLRSLGTQRTMVLIDGRRMQPANADGSVDLNLLPSSMVESVEVITGGASAVYGSDAVTGVVNFKLRRNIKGVEGSVQYGVGYKGDGDTLDYNVLAGDDFADGKGFSFIALNYSKREPVRAADHQWFGQGGSSASLPQGNINVDGNNLPSQAAVNTVFSSYGVTATIPRTSRFYFNTDGTLFLQSGATGPINYRDGFQYNARLGNAIIYDTPGRVWVQTKLNRANVFAKTEYKFDSGIEVYGQAMFADYTALVDRPPNVQGTGSSLIPLTVPVTNPFIPTDFRTLLATRPQPNAPFTIAKRTPDELRIYQQYAYNVYQLDAGARGAVPYRDWTWDVNFSQGKTSINESQINFASGIALNTLLSAADGGRSICAGGFDPFGYKPLSAACTEYVNRTTHSITEIQVTSAEANLQGELFELPAGALRFSAGLGYRKSEYSYEPDALVKTGELSGYLPIQGTSGTTDSKEAYGELLVPLIKDVPLIQEMNLALAYRYSDHKTIGGVSTYKADLDWRPFDALRFRGGYSRAVRAPSVGELFAPRAFATLTFPAPGPVGAGDACDVRSAYRIGNPNAAQVRALCLAQGVPASLVDSFQNPSSINASSISSGNTALQEEVADTYSVGAVLRPNFDSPAFSNISLSVDYYSISLEGSVGIVTSSLAMQRCFNADGTNPSYDANNFYCQLLTRRPTDGTVISALNPLLNLGGYKTSGVDVGAEWAFPVSVVGLPEDFGQLRLSTNLNYLDTFKIQTLAGAPFLDFAGTLGSTQIDPYATARPRWKAVSSINYQVGRVGLGASWRYLGKMDSANNVGTNGTLPPTEAVSYFDLNANLRVTDKFDVRAGVVNVGNRIPPVTSIDVNGTRQTDISTYDVIGRRFFIKLSARF